MIYFNDIFERVKSIFDDPDISRSYYEDPAEFQSIMLDYLMVGKDKFTYPTAITDKLLVCDAAVGYGESDSGNGTAVYTLEKELPLGPLAANKIGITCLVNGKPAYYTINKTDGKTLTFKQGPEEGAADRELSAQDTWIFKWFYAGAFSADFSNCLSKDFPMDAIMAKVINILAYATLSVWGDQEVGRVIEVRNILTDHDFKMYSPANSARAKKEWRDQMNRDMDTLVSELNWRIMSTPRGGSRFGK